MSVEKNKYRNMTYEIDYIANVNKTQFRFEISTRINTKSRKLRCTFFKYRRR